MRTIQLPSSRVRSSHVRAIIAALILVGTMAPQPVRAAPCWRPPVVAAVADPFRRPDCPYCAGNRGIDFALDGSVQVVFAAAGTVSYSGVISGARYVVVELSNGWKLTYGMLASSHLRTGDVVVGGGIVGRASQRLYFGLRVDGEYRDPAPYLGRLVARPRLIPLDGTQARPAPLPTWSCTGNDAGRRGE